MNTNTRMWLVAAAAVAVNGCTAKAPDLDFGAQPPVRRYDIVQSLAGHGAAILGGTQTGALLASADGGRTWARKDVGPHSFVAIAACPDGSYFAADFYHHVLPVAADGTPGKPVKLENPGTPLAVACDAAGRWWVAGTYATLAMSADRGQTWTVQEFGEDAHLTTLQFIDDAHGVMAGEFGMLFTTSDGGATWTRGPNLPNEFYPYAAYFASPTEGWVAGIAGQVLHTADAGATWTREPNDSGIALYRLFLVDGRLHGVGAAGVLARGDDGNWRPLPAKAAMPSFAGSAAPVLTDGRRDVVVGGVGTPLVFNLPAG
ncbi:MAG: WD40/YVTN/BNR-like repeat-containing protein [Steroidobacteraceae bacterium]